MVVYCFQKRGKRQLEINWSEGVRGHNLTSATPEPGDETLFWASAVSDMCRPQLRLQEDILKPSRMFNQHLKRDLTITADAFPRNKKNANNQCCPQEAITRLKTNNH